MHATSSAPLNVLDKNLTIFSEDGKLRSCSMLNFLRSLVISSVSDLGTILKLSPPIT